MHKIATASAKTMPIRGMPVDGPEFPAPNFGPEFRMAPNFGEGDQGQGIPVRAEGGSRVPGGDGPGGGERHADRTAHQGMPQGSIGCKVHGNSGPQFGAIHWHPPNCIVLAETVESLCMF